jgi:hypothetical protein
MGNPKQELFIQKHLGGTGCILGIGVGALFDFLAGNVPRARPWIQRLRLEWLYRLTQEPSRLARRYLVGIPLFLTRVARQFWSGARLNSAAPLPLGTSFSDMTASDGGHRLRAAAARNGSNTRKQSSERNVPASGLNSLPSP